MAKYGVAVYGVDLYGESSGVVSGGSTSLIVISATGKGIFIPLYLTITVDAEKKLSLDKKLFALQNEKVIALVVVDSSLYKPGYYAQINALLPNGIIEDKGLYDYSSLAFYVLFGDGDNILANDGTLRLQVSFVKYASDGVTLVTGKRTRIATKKVYPSIGI